MMHDTLFPGYKGPIWTQVLKMEAETPVCAAFCFHPFKPLLTAVDQRGVVRVVSYQSERAPDTKNFLDARAIVNRFHIARGVAQWVCHCVCEEGGHHGSPSVRMTGRDISTQSKGLWRPLMA